MGIGRRLNSGAAQGLVDQGFGKGAKMADTSARMQQKSRLKAELIPVELQDGLFDRAQRWGKKSTKEPPWVIAALATVILMLASGVSVYLLVRTDEGPPKNIPAGISEAPARRSRAEKNKEDIQSDPQMKAPATSSTVDSSARRDSSVENEIPITESDSSKKRVRLGEEGASVKSDPPALGAAQTARREDRPQRTRSSDMNSRHQATAASNAKQPVDTTTPLTSSPPANPSTSPSSPAKKTVIQWP